MRNFHGLFYGVLHDLLDRGFIDGLLSDVGLLERKFIDGLLSDVGLFDGCFIDGIFDKRLLNWRFLHGFYFGRDCLRGCLLGNGRLFPVSFLGCLFFSLSLHVLLEDINELLRSTCWLVCLASITAVYHSNYLIVK